MSIYDMTDDEFKSFESAIDREDWQCEHGRLFTEDCDACDTEWFVKDDAETVTEGELVEEEPERCDHDVDLFTPGFGKCAACDRECTNTDKMSDALCYRLVNGKRYKYADEQWVPVVTVVQGGTPTYSGSWAKKKECKHFMQEFVLDGEYAIYASAERDAPFNEKRNEKDYPDLAVYLYSGWVRDYEEKFVSSPGLDVPWTNSAKVPPQWPMAYIEWPDFGVPKNFNDVIACLEWIWAAIKDGKTVETGCMGGHGRTGTLLASLLAMNGTKPGSACAETWERYCEEAIESKSQVDLIVKVYEHYHGKKWRKSKTERDIIEELFKPPAPKKYEPPKPHSTPAPTRKVTCIHGKAMDEECIGCNYGGWSD